MLPKQYRLREKKDFKSVYRQSKGFKRDFFNIRTLDNQQGHARIAVVVSARANKRANKRNRIKRILTNILSKDSQILNNSKDIIISIYQIPQNEARINQIPKELNKILQ